MNTVYLILVLCLQRTSAVRTSLPVLLIDSDNVLRGLTTTTNPFHKTTAQSFADIIRTVVHRSERVIIFVEEQFSVDDLSSKDKLGTPYYYLHRGLLEHKINYIPNVVEPFKTLKHQFPPLDTNVFYVTEVLKTFDSNFQYYYIFFHDRVFNESRVERLRRHDKIMSSAYIAIRKLTQGPVVAFYTGKANPVHTGVGRSARYRPQQLPLLDPEPSDVMIVTEGALFRLSGVYSTTGARRSLQAAPAVAEQARSRRRMMTRMLYSEFELEFDFKYQPNGWLLDAVSLLEGGERVGRVTMGVGAPWDWSYYCAEPMVIVNHRDNSVVVISRYQVEPLKRTFHDSEFQSEADADGAYAHRFRRDDNALDTTAADGETSDTTDAVTTPAASAEDTVDATLSATPGSGTPASATVPSTKDSFTNTVSCGPYFNSNILAGLFVVSMLLMILTYGIITLYNCETNGRFDDANQKPLVIVAQL